MKIWLLSFESKDTVKVGGLAEVPPRIGEELSKRGFDVSLLTVNHGFLPKRHGYEVIYEEEFNGVEYSVVLYNKPRVKHLIFCGGVLDEPEVYSPKHLWLKVYEWSRVGLRFVERAVGEGEHPNVVHANDWHSVPLMMSIKYVIDGFKAESKFIYHIHLLSRAKIDLNEYASRTGVNVDQDVKGFYGWLSLREYHARSRGYVERLASLLADKTISVSRGYVKDVVKRIGLDLERNVDYVYNATTWEIEDLIEKARSLTPCIKDELSVEKVLGTTRLSLRSKVTLELENILRNDKPVVSDIDAQRWISGIDTPPFLGESVVSSFNSDGPLLLMTGRVSKQKGFHTLLSSLDKLVSEAPEVRVLLIPIPIWGERDLMNDLVEHSLMFRDNLRVVFGYPRSLFILAHLSADVMLAPSTYEPFGLVSLEAMATGIPVVASRTGGLAETVIDIEEHGVNGSGLLIEPNNPKDLAGKAKDLALFMESTRFNVWSSRWYDNLDRIDIGALRKLLLSNPHAPLYVRKSCLKRAGEFTWSRSVDKLLKIYGTP